MSNNIDLRCDPKDLAGLLAEITRRDKIINALMNQVQRNLNNPNNDFTLLQKTFVLESEVSNRTSQLQRALEALGAANKDVEAARQLLSAAIDSISEGFAIFDLQDRLVLCNDAYREMWGFQSNVEGREHSALLVEVAERHNLDSTWIARRSEEHRSGTGTSEHHFAGRTFQIGERKTQHGFIVGVYTDITELVEAQASRAARQQLLDIIDFLPDATFVVDANKSVIAWNLAMEHLTGFRKEEMIAQGDHAYGIAFYGERRPTLLDLLDGHDVSLSSRFENLRRRDETLYGEDYVQRAFDGRGAYVGRTASRLLDSDGRVVGAIESVRDLTETKRAESELESMQVQLRQTTKMEAIGRLAGGIAHDFNNQLTIVQGYCRLLLNGLRADAPNRKYAEEVLRAAERSAQLTRQLLAFGRKQVLAPEVLNPHDVLNSIRDPLARMIGEDVDISVQIEPGIWMIETDRNQFEQAIFNLAINARDAMPSGGNLTIEAKNAVIDADFVLHHLGATAGEFVCLSVCDTGTGMDEHTLRRIFEPFFTTKPVGAGTGLGLSMIYGFVRQSRGFVEASSTLGKGSRFQLYFPKSSSTPAALAPAVAATSTYLGSETILVVEDQEALLELTSHILSTGGYTVLRATDGESAVKLNREYPHAIDLALCDVVMPGLSGVEAARLMKQDRPDLKIIFMTGYSERALHSELSENVLSKPFTPDALFGAVRKLLGEPNESHEAKPH